MPYSRLFVITLGLLIAVAALAVDLNVPAVPQIARSLGAEVGATQYIITAFMAGLALGQIPAGLLSDRLGRMPVLYVGMLVFTVASLVIAAATSIELMLAARFVQGFSAATAVVLGRAIVRDVASGREAARLLSLMTMVFTAVPVFAPSIGSLVATLFDWRATFVATAVFGVLMILMMRSNLHETHTPDPEGHPVRQLINSFRLFFTTRQSILGLLLMLMLPAGYLSMITLSSSLLTETYGISVLLFGVVFGVAGGCILVGSWINRLLLARLSIINTIGAAVLVQALVGLQLGIMAWLNDASLVWLWSNVCLFMLTVGIVLPNATAMALDPLPRVAGVASSITGSLAHSFGTLGSFAGAALYDGSVRNAVVTMCAVCLFVTVIYLLRRTICPTLHEPSAKAA